MTKEELIAFEQDIADTFCAGKIRAPIHLSDGNEDQLIEIFKMIRSDDWVFSNWRSHYHALLHGIPKERLREKILAGDSITIMDADYRFFASAIVGGSLPIAMGTAMGEKMAGSSRRVWCFAGDMTAMTGDFYETQKYSLNHQLPITFVIEDNDESVGTPTMTVWGEDTGWWTKNNEESSMPKQIAPNVWRYKYKKRFPHVGAGKYVTF